MRPAGCRFLVLLALLGAGRLAAQTGSIGGTVYDSVHRVALGGAAVVLDGTPIAVRSDSAGRFALDSIPAGSYQLAVESESLDSIGVGIAPVRVVLKEGEHRVVALATASPATLLAIACAGAGLFEGEGEVSGVVRDARTHATVSGARVDLSWTVWTFIAGHLERRRTGQIIQSASDGSWIACAVPVQAMVTIRASAGDRATGTLEFRAAASGISRRDLVLGGLGESSVRGRVHAGGGTAVAGARIELGGDSAGVLSDAQGSFVIGRAPSGSQMLIVRRLGFAETRVAVELPSGSSGVAVVELDPAAHVLDAVTTLGRASSPAADALGFDARRRRGIGSFVDRSKVDAAGSVPVPELLQGVPGFTVNFSERGATAVWTRRSQNCTPIYYVDGLAVEEESTGRSTDVEELEAYSPGQAPPRYGGANARCAVVLVWTRGGPAGNTGTRSAPESTAAPP